MPANEIVVVQYKIKDVRKPGFLTSPIKKRLNPETDAAGLLGSVSKVASGSIRASSGNKAQLGAAGHTLYALPDKEAAKRHSNLSFTNRRRPSNKPPRDEHLAWEKSVQKINFDELLVTKDQEIENFRYKRRLEKERRRGAAVVKSPSANPISHSVLGRTSRYRTNPNTSGGIFRAAQGESSCIHEEKWATPGIRADDDALVWARPQRKPADLSHVAFQEKVMPFIRDGTLVYKTNLITRRPILEARVRREMSISELLADSVLEEAASVASQRTQRSDK